MAQLHCNRRWPLQEDRICLHPHRMRCDGHVALLLHQDTGNWYRGHDLISMPDAPQSPWPQQQDDHVQPSIIIMPQSGAIQVQHGTARLDMHD